MHYKNQLVMNFLPERPRMKGIGDINYWLDSTSYNIVEMTHHIWLVAIVDYLIQAHSRFIDDK